MSLTVYVLDNGKVLEYTVAPDAVRTTTPPGSSHESTEALVMLPGHMRRSWRWASTDAGKAHERNLAFLRYRVREAKTILTECERRLSVASEFARAAEVRS